MWSTVVREGLAPPGGTLLAGPPLLLESLAQAGTLGCSANIRLGVIYARRTSCGRAMAKCFGPFSRPITRWCGLRRSYYLGDERPDLVTKVRVRDAKVRGTFSVGGTTPVGVAFDGVNVRVSNSDSNNVGKLRISDGKLFKVGASPLKGQIHLPSAYHQGRTVAYQSTRVFFQLSHPSGKRLCTNIDSISSRDSAGSPSNSFVRGLLVEESKSNPYSPDDPTRLSSPVSLVSFSSSSL
jgi:hypothetical protein